MKLRVLGVGTAIAGTMILPAPAEAQPPVGGCPVPFQGPYDAPTIIEMFPPPPDITDPEASILQFDRNDDQLVCVQDVPGPRINIVDNVLRAR